MLCDDPRVNGHRPSADVLLRSAADEFNTQVVGVLMTGMGDDGAEGLGAVKKAGGMTIAQSEDLHVLATSVSSRSTEQPTAAYGSIMHI